MLSLSSERLVDLARELQAVGADKTKQWAKLEAVATEARAAREQHQIEERSPWHPNELAALAKGTR